MVSIGDSQKIKKDDGLPTAVCVKCIGALEFLCDFYDWCHRTQQTFNEQLRNSADSESELSGSESDKENISPEKCAKQRKLKNKVSTTEVTEKSHAKEVVNLQEEVTQAAPVAAELETENSRKEDTNKPENEGEISQDLGDEILVSLRKNGVNVTSPSSSIETISKTRRSFEKTGKKQTKEKAIVTPLTEWLTGNAMNKKRKRDDDDDDDDDNNDRKSSVEKKIVISRVSESRYSKISELMTDEQKETVENYYRVDMSVVDEIKVAENMKIHSRNEIECKICKQKYNRMDKCQVHIWRHLEMKPYFCSACSFSTLTVTNIRCHIRKSHLKIKPYVCPLCEKQYTSPTSLEEHLNTHTGAKPFRCRECNFSSASKQVLSYHKLTHKQEKDVECDVCGKTFFSKGRLRTHKFIHMKDTSFKCKFCSTYFMHKEALERHYNTSHVQDYRCDICNKTYKSKKALSNHQNVHSEPKYQCSLCPRRYKSHHILKEHLLKHGGIRKYKCDTCEKTFAQQSHLAAHMAVHIGIRYECPGCKKGFNRHDNMKAHTKRCGIFLRNPALKELLTSKVKMKTESVSSIETNIDNISISSRGSVNSGKIANTTRGKKIMTKVELNVDLENSDHDSDTSMYHYPNDEGILRKTSEILHSCAISDEDDDEDEDENIITRGELSVTENILSPECF